MSQYNKRYHLPPIRKFVSRITLAATIGLHEVSHLSSHQESHEMNSIPYQQDTQQPHWDYEYLNNTPPFPSAVITGNHLSQPTGVTGFTFTHTGGSGL